MKIILKIYRKKLKKNKIHITKFNQCKKLNNSKFSQKEDKKKFIKYITYIDLEECEKFLKQ